MRKFFQIVFFILIDLSNCLLAQQPTITSTPALNAVNNVLLGSGITTSNIIFNGMPQQLGYFTHGASFGIDTGIVLSTGNVVDITGSVAST